MKYWKAARAADRDAESGQAQEPAGSLQELTDTPRTLHGHSTPPPTPPSMVQSSGTAHTCRRHVTSQAPWAEGFSTLK